MFTILAVVIGAIISFICTLLLFKSGKIEKGNNSVIESKDSVVVAPICGKVKSINECKDDAFRQETLGKGIIIEPEEGKVFAPFDGNVVMIFKTLHAIGLVSNDGVELLIHVGLNTVDLNGEGFISHINNGDIVKQGQLLLEFDLESFKEQGIDVTTPVVVTNTAAFLNIKPTFGQLNVGDEMLKIEK